jgi:hypothetical protein
MLIRRFVLHVFGPKRWNAPKIPRSSDIITCQRGIGCHHYVHIR